MKSNNKKLSLYLLIKEKLIVNVKELIKILTL